MSKLILKLSLAAAMACTMITGASAQTTVAPWFPGGGPLVEALAANSAAPCGIDPVLIKYGYKYDVIDATTGLDSYAPNAGEPGDEEPGDAPQGVITFTRTSNSVTWTSPDYPVYVVVMKGGNAANIYCYPEGAYEGTVVTPINPKNGKRYGLSHVTFGYGDIIEPQNFCYQAETAWTAGDRYVTQGNWATYTTYVAGAKVNIFAGQTYLVGTAEFSAPDIDGNVTITIELNGVEDGGAIFNDEVLENIKIQDYATPPSGNPNPGGFTWKWTAIDEQTATVVVPLANYYGVHLDVLRVYECPPEP